MPAESARKRTNRDLPASTATQKARAAICAFDLYGATGWKLPGLHCLISKTPLVLVCGKQPSIWYASSTVTNIDDGPYLWPKLLASRVEQVLQSAVIGGFSHRFT